MGDFGGYGPYAIPLAIISVLAQVLYNVTKKRRENGSTEDFRTDLKTEIAGMRRNIHEIRDLMQAVVTKAALLEYRVSRLEDERGHK